LPLTGGDYDVKEDISPLGYHTHVDVPSPPVAHRVVESLCDSKLSMRLKHVLVDAQNIDGALQVVDEAEVLSSCSHVVLGETDVYLYIL
jgi:hypothetical protein